MRRGLVICGLVALSLSASACGGGGKKAALVSNLTPVAYVKSAAQKTAQAPSEHVNVTGTVVAAGNVVDLKGSGDFDNTVHLGALHATFSASGVSGDIDEVMNGLAIYLKSPIVTASLPSGKTWLKLDLGRFAASKGLNFSALLSQSPTRSFAQLAAAGAVTRVGDESVGGVDTTHYRVRLDVAKLPQGAKIAALTKASYGPIDVWIGNGDGYVHKVQISLSETVPGSGRLSMSMNETFSKFGETVDVSVPSDSDTYDGTSSAIKGLGS